MASNVTNTEVTRQLSGYDEVIPVVKGDLIALYFPLGNPIPYSTFACNSNMEKLRFTYEPITMDTGDQFDFETAPLNLDPCRHYSVNMQVG